MTSTVRRSRGASLAVLHAGTQGGFDVPEDAHRAELSETAGAAEREHPLPDVLRRGDRPHETADELQAAGRHNNGTCRQIEDPTAAGHTGVDVEAVHEGPGDEVHGRHLLRERDALSD